MKNTEDDREYETSTQVFHSDGFLPQQFRAVIHAPHNPEVHRRLSSSQQSKEWTLAVPQTLE
jgi:hypothetical protein